MKKFKKNENSINKDNFFIHMFIWTWIYIVILSVFIFFSINVKAASDNLGKLPIRTPVTSAYFNLTEDALGISPQEVFDYGHDFLCNTYNIDEDTEYFIVLGDVNYNSYLTGRWRFYMTYVFLPTFNGNVYDDTNYLNQTLTFSGTKYNFSCDWQYGVPSTLNYMNYGTLNGNDITLYGSDADSVQYSTSVNNVGTKSISYVPLWVVYYSGDGIYSTNDNLILTNLSTNPPPMSYTGHATAPNNLPDYFPDVDLSHTPTPPTINNYNFTTYTSPTIDTSSLESLVESLIDVVVYNFSYLLTNISGIVSNAINNISDFFDYVIDSIKFGFKSLIENIQNAVETFYNNLVSLFEPVFEIFNDLYVRLALFIYKVTDFIDLFIHPFNYDEFEQDFENWEFKQRTDELAHSFSDFVAVFSSAHEPETYTLYIGWLMEMPDHSFREVNCDQNLDWLNDLKPTYRPILWVITLIELFQFITTHVQSFISGRYE